MRPWTSQCSGKAGALPCAARDAFSVAELMTVVGFGSPATELRAAHLGARLWARQGRAAISRNRIRYLMVLDMGLYTLCREFDQNFGVRQRFQELDHVRHFSAGIRR